MVDSIVKQLQAFLATLGIVATMVSPTPAINPTNITTAPSTAVVQELQVSPTQKSAPQAINVPAPNGSSRNWSGYASTERSFTFIKGTWTIPSVAANGHAGADVAWVGIGGISTSDLIQAGTQNLISSSGQITTSAFYEVLPAASQAIPMKINIGDSITITITETSTNQWSISLVDNTNGRTFNTNISYTSSHSSAEWIEEAPSDGNLILPLDSFGSIQFTNGLAIQNGNQVTITQSNAQPITMVNAANQTIASSSSLGTDGSGFIVTRSAAESSAPIPALDQNVRNFRRHGFGIGHYIPLTQEQRRQRFWIRPTINPSITQTPTITTEPEPTQVSNPSGNFWDRLFPFFFHRGVRMRRIQF